MTHTLSLDQLAARSAAIVANWPAGKREHMQLQGTDTFQERLKLGSASPRENLQVAEHQTNLSEEIFE